MCQVLFLAKFKVPEKKYIEKKITLWPQENIHRGCSGKRRALACNGCAVGVWFPLRGCLFFQWIWSSYYDEVMAMPVSLGHALSAHSFSLSSLTRCWKESSWKSCCKEPANPSAEIPVLGSADTTRRRRQHRPSHKRVGTEEGKDWGKQREPKIRK